MGQGPSVLIIEDRNGYIFGGFASHSWALGPKYYGNESCFLFTLSPKMRVFPSTGYNNHYMYLNLHQQTMPNGLVSLFSILKFRYYNQYFLGNGRTTWLLWFMVRPRIWRRSHE